MDVAIRDGLAFVADAVYHHDPTILYEKPQQASIEFAHVAQFQQPDTKRLGQRFPVILPAPQFCETGDHSHKVVRVTGL